MALTEKLFDVNYYLSTYSDVAINWTGSPFDHYTQFGALEGRAPNSYFDAQYYRANNTDLANLNALQLLEHYENFGYMEGRAPSSAYALFDEATYLSTYSDLGTAGITADTALNHFLQFGSAEGRLAFDDNGNAVPGVVSGAGSTFALTTGVDTIAGTSGNDTINGVLDDDTAANNTLSVIDTIDGGAGTDTLNVVADDSSAGLTFPPASISGIEIFNIRNLSGQTVSINALNFNGETTFASDRSTHQLTVTNVAAGTAIDFIGDGVVATGALSATHSASVTAGSLNIKNGTTGGALTMNGAGLTTLAIASTGAANTTGAISTNSAAITGVTISATTSLTTGGLSIAGTTGSVENLTITGAAANVAATSTADEAGAVVLGALDANFVAIDASGLTAGGVEATLSATVTATFTGGAGNDIITTSTTGQTGVVNAGDGTGDMLILNASADIDSTAEGAIYQGFEILMADNGTSIDMDLMTGSTITGIIVNDTAAGATSVTNMTAAQAANVTIKDFNDAATFGVKDATTVGNIDVLNFTISDGDTTGSEDLLGGTATDGAVWTIAGVETINLILVDDFDADDMSNITGMTRLTASGDGDLDIITDALDLGSNGGVDFGSVTGSITFNAAALATNAFAYTGGSGVDAVTDNVIGGNQISLGAGNDTLTLTDKTGGTATTEVTGGAGADTITVNMLGNVARDAMKFNFAAGDSVSDSSATGISATLTDTITNLDGAALSLTAGSSVEFDTEVQATAVTAGTTDVVLGTTTVANAGDFFVNIDAANTTYIYQDTDGDGIIEAGEFALALTGIQNSILAAGEFTVSGGDLILATA